MNNEFIYHVISQEEWENTVGMELYSPPSLQNEGFIHFSFKEQIPGVIERFYSHQVGLLVLKVAVNKIKSRLKFEMVSTAGLFPHLYGQLNTDSIVGVYPICIDENKKVFWSE